MVSQKRPTVGAFCRRLRRNGLNSAKIIFSDSAVFTIRQNPGQTPPFSGQNSPQNAHSVLVWAAIGVNFRYLRIVPQGPNERRRLRPTVYVQTVLDDLIKRSALHGRVLVQDEGAYTRHQYTRRHLANAGIQWLDQWPKRCPRLNPIGWLLHRLQRLADQQGPRDAVTLASAVELAWNSVPQAQINGYARFFDQMAAFEAATGP